MQIAFVRTGESHDRIHVTRDDGTELTWRWPASGLPHDLTHWLVERELGMTEGFWGLIAGGVDVGAVQSAAEHRRTRLGDRDVTTLQQAEAVAGALMLVAMVPETTDEECRVHVAAYCARAGVAMPEGADFERLRARMSDLAAQWQATAAGAAITVKW